MIAQSMRTDWADLTARVRGFVRRRVKDRHAAEDIVQDVLLKVQAQMGAAPAEDRLSAWVFAVARNAIVDHYRQRAARDHADVANVDPMAEAPPGDEDAAARDLAPCLLRMIEHLPEPYRQAVKLAELEGVTQRELAHRVGVSLSGAKSRVQRARQQLREMVLDCCHVEHDRRGNVIDFETTKRSAGYCGDADGKPQCGG
jgi:RNA polymerase sigma-70 factor (ECF subfamily)